MNLKQEKYFDYGYISKDKVLQKILQTLLCQSLFSSAELLSYFKTEQEVIENSDICLGDNVYFNNLPLKCRLFLIINFIRGLSDPHSLPENLDCNFYLTVDHLFSHLASMIDEEVVWETDTEFDLGDNDSESDKNEKREYLKKCLHIIMSEDPPQKSIEVFDIRYYNHEDETFDEDGEKFDSDIIREGWSETVGYLQANLFGGFGEGEFIWSKERISESIREHPLLSQLCVNYSLLELAKQYVDIVSKYGDIELPKLKEICSK